MAPKRDTLIRVRNQSLQDSRIPQKAVLATKTDSSKGRIAWVTDRVLNPWYRDAYLGGKSRHPARYGWTLAQYNQGRLDTIAEGGAESLIRAKEIIEDMIRRD